MSPCIHVKWVTGRQNATCGHNVGSSSISKAYLTNKKEIKNVTLVSMYIKKCHSMETLSDENKVLSSNHNMRPCTYDTHYCYKMPKRNLMNLTFNSNHFSNVFLIYNKCTTSSLVSCPYMNCIHLFYYSHIL